MQCALPNWFQMRRCYRSTICRVAYAHEWVTAIPFMRSLSRTLSVSISRAYCLEAKGSGVNAVCEHLAVPTNSFYYTVQWRRIRDVRGGSVYILASVANSLPQATSRNRIHSCILYIILHTYSFFRTFSRSSPSLELSGSNVAPIVTTIRVASGTVRSTRTVHWTGCTTYKSVN